MDNTENPENPGSDNSKQNKPCEHALKFVVLPILQMQKQQ